MATVISSLIPFKFDEITKLNCYVDIKKCVLLLLIIILSIILIHPYMYVYRVCTLLNYMEWHLSTILFSL